jgi:hypothetical protein
MASACSQSTDASDSGSTSSQGSNSPAAYETSTRISVEYDDSGDVLRLMKPATAQCFWIQMWSPESNEWATVASIPDNGRTAVAGGASLFDAPTSPLANPINDPGCDDVGLEPAELWTVPFAEPEAGHYRLWWLEEGEYSGSVQIS